MLAEAAEKVQAGDFAVGALQKTGLGFRRLPFADPDTSRRKQNQKNSFF